MNRCLTLLAATLTLTAACGDNVSVPLEVDDSRTADFERYTVDTNGNLMSADYVAPDSIFSYLRDDLVRSPDFMLEVGAVGRLGSPIFTEDSGIELVDLNDIKWDLQYPTDRFGDLTDADGNLIDNAPTATEAQRCNSFSRAPGNRDDATGDHPDELAPEAIETETSTGANREDLGDRDMLGDSNACREIADNDADPAGVCECADLDCVAGYVDAVMGCDVCMTFVCGEQLLGACSACSP